MAVTEINVSSNASEVRASLIPIYETETLARMFLVMMEQRIAESEYDIKTA